MTASAKKMAEDFKAQGIKMADLEIMVSNLKFENQLLQEGADRAKQFAEAQARASMAGEVASAFRDGLAYGKELFKEMRAIV